MKNDYLINNKEKNHYQFLLKNYFKKWKGTSHKNTTYNVIDFIQIKTYIYYTETLHILYNAVYSMFVSIL